MEVAERDLLRSRDYDDEILQILPLHFDVELIWKKPLDDKVVQFRRKQLEQFVHKYVAPLKNDLGGLKAQVRTLKEADEDGDQKAYAAAQAEVRKVLAKIEAEVFTRLITAMKQHVADWSGEDAAKMQSVATIDFRGRGPGVSLRPGVFKGGAAAEQAEKSRQALKKTLQKVKTKPVDLPEPRKGKDEKEKDTAGAQGAKPGDGGLADGAYFVFCDGSPGGLVVSPKRIRQAQKIAAREQCTERPGPLFYGRVRFENGKFTFAPAKKTKASFKTKLKAVLKGMYANVAVDAD
jgi:hypothetical protein